jgi:hypothetical protein
VADIAGLSGTGDGEGAPERFPRTLLFLVFSATSCGGTESLTLTSLEGVSFTSFLSALLLEERSFPPCFELPLTFFFGAADAGGGYLMGTSSFVQAAFRFPDGAEADSLSVGIAAASFGVGPASTELIDEEAGVVTGEAFDWDGAEGGLAPKLGQAEGTILGTEEVSVSKFSLRVLVITI